MVEVNIVGYEDLTEAEREDQPHNGVGREDANYIKVTTLGGTTLLILSDAVEPEDATFRRDFKDVAIALQTMYTRGYKDAMIIKYQELRGWKGQ